MEASLDSDDTPETGEPSDAYILKARREALRAFVDDIATHVQRLDLPLTYLEAERAARCITVHDHAIETLPQIAGDVFGVQMADSEKAALKPIRRHLRRYADRVMEAVTIIPKPASFLEGERAGRYALAADRMLTQLYEAPRPAAAKSAARSGKPVFADDLDDEEDEEEEVDEASLRERTARVMTLLDRRMSEYVRNNCGVWPDGTPCVPGEPDPPYPFDQADRATLMAVANPARIPENLVPDAHRGNQWLLMLINRINAPARARARRDGHWPDNTPYSDDDPDYYSISERYDELEFRKPPQPPSGIIETPGPSRFPKWVVHKLPKETRPPP